MKLEVAKIDFLSHNYTDSLRGVAIIFVMIQHVLGGCYECRYFTPLGGIGVAIFLVLSGYGLNESFRKRGLSGYWGKKILRVFVPYAILCSILAYFRHTTISDYLLNIFGIKTSYWYVGFLLKQYIIFYFATKYSPKFRLLIMLATSVVVLLLFPNIEAEQAFSFFAGVLISQNIEFFKKISFKKYTIISLVLFIIGLLFLGGF